MTNPFEAPEIQEKLPGRRLQGASRVVVACLFGWISAVLTLMVLGLASVVLPVAFGDGFGMWTSPILMVSVFGPAPIVGGIVYRLSAPPPSPGWPYGLSVVLAVVPTAFGLERNAGPAHIPRPPMDPALPYQILGIAVALGLLSQLGVWLAGWFVKPAADGSDSRRTPGGRKEP